MGPPKHGDPPLMAFCYKRSMEVSRGEFPAESRLEARRNLAQLWQAWDVEKGTVSFNQQKNTEEVRQ